MKIWILNSMFASGIVSFDIHLQLALSRPSDWEVKHCCHNQCLHVTTGQCFCTGPGEGRQKTNCYWDNQSNFSLVLTALLHQCLDFRVFLYPLGIWRGTDFWVVRFQHITQVYLGVFELLFDILYNRSAVKADENTANKFWVNRVCTNHLPCDLCQCSNTSRCEVSHSANTTT